MAHVIDAGGAPGIGKTQLRFVLVSGTAYCYVCCLPLWWYVFSTQLAVNCCIPSALGGVEGEAVFIGELDARSTTQTRERLWALYGVVVADTEGSFHAARASEIASAMVDKVAAMAKVRVFPPAAHDHVSSLTVRLCLWPCCTESGHALCLDCGGYS